VDKQTPGIPVNLPMVAAIKPAACSCLVTTNLIEEFFIA